MQVGGESSTYKKVDMVQASHGGITVLVKEPVMTRSLWKPPSGDKGREMCGAAGLPVGSRGTAEIMEKKVKSNERETKVTSHPQAQPREPLRSAR
jgi:hypothetical protein